MRKIAISDIHGCSLSFGALLDQLALTTTDELYLLGDFIDRGPDSKAVLDQVFSLEDEGYTVHCLRGNHEDAFQISCRNPDFFYSWYDGWGGKQTLESFDVRMPNSVPFKYRHFMKKLGYVLEVDEYILVHAGLDFRYSNPLTPNEDMLYARDWYDSIDYGWLGDRIIVHGHTPVARETIEKLWKKLDHYRVLDIDGGCFAQHLPGKGWLCAFDMTNRELFFQKNLDDVSGYWKSR
jgi:serine/threonine protein phosphatase 1